ncbi:hypothetical protein [Actinokineospora sp. HUAS TT18]|uniref:hypothetical protein n=1 Tax=Actinokineospora sp. HUAS TT18 TaxID=3447451 RepID=UPI003F51DF5D
MTDPNPLATFARVADSEQRRFEGRNLRVRRSPVVHAVRAAPWLASLTLPAPACGQGWSGTGVGELHPVSDPVTCSHCLASAQARAAAADPDRSQQLALPLPMAAE